MKKYKVFRAVSGIGENVNGHELIAVEYGKDVYDATDRLIKAAKDDALGLDKYQKGFSAAVYAPRLLEDCNEDNQYTYSIMAVLCPEYGEENDLIDYGIIEEDE